MKPIRFFSTFLVLTSAATVTVGSMYATVQAAAQQQSDVDAFASDASDGNSRSLPVEPAINAPLTPEKIQHGRSHSVVLDAQGGFSGRLSSLTGVDGVDLPAAGYSVKVLQHGAVAGTTTSSADGRFEFTSLKPGVAGILAFSETGLMLFGVRLAAPTDASAVAGIGNSVELDIDSAVVASADVKMAYEMIGGSLADSDQRFSADLSTSDDEFQIGTGDAATSLVGHRVQLQDDGTLHGEVNILDERTGRHREILDLTVHFLKNGRIEASAEVDNNGAFIATGLTTGVHSVIGTGKDGVFAVGIEIVGSSYEPTTDGKAGANDATPVAIVQSIQFGIAPIGPGNLNSGNFPSITGQQSQNPPGTPPAPAPLASMGPMGAPGGGLGGASGGGGGGIGGGGFGLGGLLAGIAGGVGGYLAGQNNDDDPSSPSK